MLVGCIRICPSISTLLRKLNRHAWLSTTGRQHIAQRCSRLNPSPVYQQKTRNTRMLSSCSLLLLYNKNLLTASRPNELGFIYVQPVAFDRRSIAEPRHRCQSLFYRQGLEMASTPGP